MRIDILQLLSQQEMVNDSMHQCFIPSVSIVNLNNTTGKERTSSEHTQYPGPIDHLLPFFIYDAGDELGEIAGALILSKCI
jgi:hypothetical protein